MRVRAKLIFLIVSCLLLLAATSDEAAPLLGYSAASSRTQRDWETKFRTIPTPANLRDMVIVGYDHPTFASRHLLVGIKGKGGRITKLAEHAIS